MTLLSDIVKALRDAEVLGYTVRSSVRELPGDPDLVVVIEEEAEQEVADVLNTAELPILATRNVGQGVIHVWQRPPSD
jgi:hypothetical protein